jgi:flagellar basal-body rod protein FlgB
MKVSLFEDPTLQAMGSYMTRLSRRQQIVASNIANIDTPGFRASDVSFHATMSELLATPESPMRGTRSGHIAQMRPAYLAPEPFEIEGLTERVDGNNVDLDREMLNLSETAFGYATISQLLRTKFRGIASAIQEGRSA